VYSGDINFTGSTSAPLTQTVTPPVLQSIAISSPSNSISRGASEQFTATGTYSDGSTSNITNQVTWNSASPSVATISTTGLATGIGTGTSNITAILSGVTSNTFVLTVTPSIAEPGIFGSILDKNNSNGSYYVDLQLKNTGAGVASNLQLTRLTFRTLAGTGTVTYDTTQSSQLPIQVPTIPAGSSATIRLFLNVPSTVSRFSINENGTVQNVAGNSFNWSSGQALFY
jgi:Bacterial Ig-like domain (group 2)